MLAEPRGSIPLDGGKSLAEGHCGCWRPDPGSAHDDRRDRTGESPVNPEPSWRSPWTVCIATRPSPQPSFLHRTGRTAAAGVPERHPRSRVSVRVADLVHAITVKK